MAFLKNQPDYPLAQSCAIFRNFGTKVIGSNPSESKELTLHGIMLMDLVDTDVRTIYRESKTSYLLRTL